MGLFYHYNITTLKINYLFHTYIKFIFNTKAEILVTLWLHLADDVSESPFLSVFLKVTILQVPSSAVLSKGNLGNDRVSFFIISRNHNCPSLSNKTKGFQISIILYPSLPYTTYMQYEYPCSPRRFQSRGSRPSPCAPGRLRAYTP